MRLAADNLDLLLQTLDEARAMLENMPPSDRAEMSPAWLARFQGLTSPDPWIVGFSMVHRESGKVVGQAGFKGPPAPDGAVEIAYAVEPDYQGRGYATEAARALTDYALASRQVRVVRAHTLPEHNPSTRVLAKCGFQFVGEVTDPEDGQVWRWERRLKQDGM